MTLTVGFSTVLLAMKLAGVILKMKLDLQADRLVRHTTRNLLSFGFGPMGTQAQSLGDNHPFAVDLDDAVVDLQHRQNSQVRFR
jgi:hypothetical protein